MMNELKRVGISFSTDVLEEIDKISDDMKLNSRSSTIAFLLSFYKQYKDIPNILTDINNELIGAKLSSRQAQKNSTIILEVLNNILLNKSLDIKDIFLLKNKKSGVIIKALDNYSKMIEKYIIRKNGEKRNKNQ